MRSLKKKIIFVSGCVLSGRTGNVSFDGAILRAGCHTLELLACVMYKQTAVSCIQGD